MKKRADEIHDEVLFRPPPKKEECPICLLRLPSLNEGSSYYSCCGKIVCNGCHCAPVYDDLGNTVDEIKCPFCRTPAAASDEECMERMKKRAELGDAEAIYSFGVYYCKGLFGFPQNNVKALELCHRAAELGHAAAYFNIGCAYANGTGVERDMKKAKQYYKLAAVRGYADARQNLALREEAEGNMNRALKHWIYAVEGGCSESLKGIRRLFKNGHATKDEYAKALRSYQAYLDEIRSDERDKAAAFDDRYKYY